MKRKRKPKKYGQRFLDKVIDVGKELANVDDDEFVNLCAQIKMRCAERGVKLPEEMWK